RPRRHLHRQRGRRLPAQGNQRRDRDQLDQPRTEPRRDIPDLLQSGRASRRHHAMTAIRFALQLGRWGLVVFSLGGFLATLVNAIGCDRVAGRTQAEREAFARSFAQIAAQLTVLLPPPSRLDTMAGYVQFRGYGSLAIVFALRALADASRRR